MPSAVRVVDIRAALEERLFPSVTVWNRLEGRPRTLSFDRALRAEVRDALWLLTKQWQMGEFRGSDAGSPVSAKLQIDTTRLTQYRPGTGAVQAFDETLPLEAKVERRPVPLRIHGRVASLDVRLAMGREWLALTSAIGHRQAFIDAYPVVAPDPTLPADAELCAHPQVWELFAAAAGRAMDGGLLYEHLLASAANHAYDGVAGIPNGDHLAIDHAAERFLAWFDRLIVQPPPSGDDAWTPPALEYRFAASAPEGGGAEKVYVADSYYQGRLDWYSLDVDASAKPLGEGAPPPGLPTPDVRTMLPVSVSFSGMPNTRWWSFEEQKTNYGDVSASTTDLAKLLFLEFALVYGNDWFVVPYTLPSGTIAAVRGLAVTNVFGERFWIEPSGSGLDSDWQRWSMFTINVENEVGEANAPADTSLLLLPTVGKVDQGPPTEDVMLIRDEVANMVWGIEVTVPLRSGDTAPGIEAARQLRAFYEAQLGAAPAPVLPPSAAIRYQIMSTVPENWIPFVPVHVDGDNREIQLQRAAMPRILEGDPNPPVKVQPRTVLLREGLDHAPAETYFVHEEEVPRAGTRALQAYERTRWTDGSVTVWLRVRRQTGRGEGSSGLAFDEIVPQPFG